MCGKVSGMRAFDATSDWKEFLANPKTRRWQEAIARRFQERLQGEGAPSAESFADISGEFPGLLREKFNLMLERHGYSHTDEVIELQEAQWLLGQALALVFLSSGGDALKILKSVEGLFAWEGFKEGLRAKADDREKVLHMLARFRAAIDSLEQEPGKYSRFASEKERLGELLRQWREERTLEEFYAPWGWDFFPVRVPPVGALGLVLPTYSPQVAELLSAITLPPAMHEALWIVGENCTGNEGESFSALLRDAPECGHATGAGWNGQLLAPALLQWGLTHGWHELETARGDDDASAAARAKIAAMWETFAQVLRERPDGHMLATAFLASHLPRERAESRPTDLMGEPWRIAREALAKILPDLSGPTEELFQENFGKSMAEAEADWKRFVQTGSLHPAEPRMKLGIFLSLLPDGARWTEANAAAALKVFRYLPGYEAVGLFTSEHGRLPEKSHEAVGRLLALMADPVGSWSQLWTDLSGVRHRLRQSPYGAQAIDQYSALNFLLVAGVCAIGRLKEGNRAEAATAMAHAVVRALRQYAAWAGTQRRFLERVEVFEDEPGGN